MGREVKGRGLKGAGCRSLARHVFEKIVRRGWRGERPCVRGASVDAGAKEAAGRIREVKICQTRRGVNSPRASRASLTNVRAQGACESNSVPRAPRRC